MYRPLLSLENRSNGTLVVPVACIQRALPAPDHRRRRTACLLKGHGESENLKTQEYALNGFWGRVVTPSSTLSQARELEQLREGKRGRPAKEGGGGISLNYVMYSQVPGPVLT